MKKRFVIVRPLTGCYFTDDSSEWWSPFIEEAKTFEESEIEDFIANRSDIEMGHTPLAVINFLKIETFYIL